MGCISISLSPPMPAAAAPTRVDEAVQLADRLIDSCHLRGRTGMLYRENLATYIHHAVGDKGISEMLAANEPVSVASIRAHMQPMAAQRWIVKIERDVKTPYKDAEVFDRLEKLDDEFHEQVAQLKADSGGKPFRILINGSLCKGRIGKNSDIDGQVETADPKFRETLLHNFCTRPHDNVSFFPFSAGPEGRVEERISGPVLDLGDGGKLLADRRYLTNYYLDVMRHKGYVIDVGANGRPRVKSYAPAGERRREAKLVLEKFFELSRTDVQGNEVWRHLKKWSFTTAGVLLAVPVVGSAVAWGLEKLCPSKVQKGDA